LTKEKLDTYRNERCKVCKNYIEGKDPSCREWIELPGILYTPGCDKEPVYFEGQFALGAKECTDFERCSYK